MVKSHDTRTVDHTARGCLHEAVSKVVAAVQTLDTTLRSCVCEHHAGAELQAARPYDARPSDAQNDFCLIQLLPNRTAGSGKAARPWRVYAGGTLYGEVIYSSQSLETKSVT